MTHLIPCNCGDSCTLCNDGSRALDVHDVIKLRRTSLNRAYFDLVKMCDRALADAEDAIAWHACAEALR